MTAPTGMLSAFQPAPLPIRCSPNLAEAVSSLYDAARRCLKHFHPSAGRLIRYTDACTLPHRTSAYVPPLLRTCTAAPGTWWVVLVYEPDTCETQPVYAHWCFSPEHAAQEASAYERAGKRTITCTTQAVMEPR